MTYMEEWHASEVLEMLELAEIVAQEESEAGDE